jgi:hypothetical protein
MTPLRISRGLCLFGLLAGHLSTIAFATEFANVEYLCADWGPAMKLPSKPADKPQFSDMDEEIYFLKQVTARGKVSIYICKMKPDGTGKTEIKQLWKNPNYPIDAQGQSAWMDVNAKTRKIALSVLFAGTDEMGLWTMNLDGSEFKQILKPEWGEHLVGVDHPSWTPDGRWIVFAEIQRCTHPNRVRVARCDREGWHFSYLTSGPWQGQPMVSPVGDIVVYEQVGDARTGGLYVTDINGKKQRQLFDPAGKPVTGTYPAWSPDGTKIFAVSTGVIEVSTGKTLFRRSPRSVNSEGKTVEQYSNVVMPHWGKLGLLCSGWGGGITVVDDQFDIQRVLADSGKVAPK